MALAKAACAMHGFTPDITVTGGGSDANFLNAYGLPSVILGTGMAHVHTVDEYIKEEDLYNTALMVHGILKAAVKIKKSNAVYSKRPACAKRAGLFL